MKFLSKLRRVVMDSFGFSRTEANGLIVLLFIVFLTAIVPRIYLDNKRARFQSDPEALQRWANEMKASIKAKGEREKKMRRSIQPKQHVAAKPFDPNNAPDNIMQAAGIPSFLSRRIIKYRNSGGKFREKEDIKKIYGFSEELYLQVEKYIDIQPRFQEEQKAGFDSQPALEPSNEFHPKELFELNSATAEELKQISGIGPVLSERIVKYRDLLGGFHDHTQLNEVYGLKPEVIQKISRQSDLIANIHPIVVNTDSIKGLARHPYIDYNLARAIVNYRSVHGDYQRLDELKNIKLLSDSLYHKLSPYLSISEQ